MGGPYYMHRDDLKVLAPQWLNYTHIMRDDMEVRGGVFVFFWGGEGTGREAGRTWG